jgi:hypothetical protein
MSPSIDPFLYWKDERFLHLDPSWPSASQLMACSKVNVFVNERRMNDIACDVRLAVLKLFVVLLRFGGLLRLDRNTEVT